MRTSADQFLMVTTDGTEVWTTPEAEGQKAIDLGLGDEMLMFGLLGILTVVVDGKLVPAQIVEGPED